MAVAGANAHDKTLVEEILASLPQIPEGDPFAQPMCMDRAYDSADIRVLLQACGCTSRTKSRSQVESERRSIPGCRARRWVCERAHSWFNRFRRILVRREMKAENYTAFLHLACTESVSAN